MAGGEKLTFSIGDDVIVRCRASHYDGRSGQIDRIVTTGSPYRVRFSDTEAAWFDQDELEAARRLLAETEARDDA